ncbi:HPr-rel-A system PqqD family peptide chaperone [Rhodoferax sp.]|uniref:HPr-rel-A system PqqD family peptide chaperone n=1 Tax=Rhodoferax sp. TaxID=50421 RepID=UPI00374D2983
MTAPAARWHSVAPDQIVWRDFDDEFVIFNQQTGSTHLLSGMGAAMLQALLDTPDGLSLADLQTQLTIDAESSVDSDLIAESLQSVLSSFEALGLAEMDVV